MTIDNPTGDPDCERNQYTVRFDLRRVEDVRFTCPTQAFERVRLMSETNEQLYRAAVSPWVRAAANPWLAASMQWLHPMRASRYLWSERFFPWMGVFAVLADTVSSNRHALAEDAPLIALERRLIAQVSDFWEAARKLRDAGTERTFRAMFGE